MTFILQKTFQLSLETLINKRNFSYILSLLVVGKLSCTRELVHVQVTIIFVVSVCLSVGLFVFLFVCAEFFSAVFDPI